MEKIKYREIEPLNLDNEGKPLDINKQKKGLPEIKREVLKYAISLKGKEGVIKVWTNGNYELAMIAFEEGNVSESEESKYNDVELTAISGKGLEELDKMVKVYWEILWAENQTSIKYKSYISIFASDNYAKFRSKHQDN